MIASHPPPASTSSRSARRALLAGVVLVPLACASVPAPSPRPPAAPPPAPAMARAGGDAGADAAPAGPEVPSLDAIAARGPSDLPLMREVLRVADATTPSVIAAGANDVCFRASVAASVPVRAWFEDESHAPRGGQLSASTGLVPPRGPACARKGEKLRLVVDASGAATVARAVVWQAP